LPDAAGEAEAFAVVLSSVADSFVALLFPEQACKNIATTIRLVIFFI